MNFFNVLINAETLFVLSTSGSQRSIEKHNKALQAIGVNLVYFTFGHKILPEMYANLLKSPIIKGGAVTGQGLKSGIIPFIDKVDQLAKNTNAVNTVVNRSGRLYGYNTDVFGFETAIKKHIKASGIKIKKAIIYGYGGVSGVAAHVLNKMGIEVTMTGRNQEKVKVKMCELGLNCIEGPYNLFVNATPVSSEQIEKAIGLVEVLRESKIVFDHNMPEKDGKKNYLRAYCEDNDIYFIPGEEMYIPQMIKQWRLFLDGISNNDGQVMAITDEDIIKFWKL